MKRPTRSRAWRGATTTFAALLALSLVATNAVNGFRTDIDKFLGTSSTELVTEDVSADDYTYQSDYSTTTELVQSVAELGERMQEEGSVLLKNNGALPLTEEETQHVTLLGFSSYYPVMGGDMGSSLTENEGTDADTVDFVEALEAKGYSINQTVSDLYASLEDSFTTEVNNFGMISEVTRITAPATDGVFSSMEPSQELLASADEDWQSSMDEDNIMIITIARAAGENRTYLPGTDGVDSSQDLNQTDPLGLSDDERDLIEAAVEAKESNGGKVIVLINSSSQMEIEEIENNDGVDAIMHIGLPGGYGFYGVADLLSGDANPSGRLADTYAVTNANSPAAQNYGDYAWTNADDSTYVNSAIVEAEGIYVGYLYYETRYADTVLGQGDADSTVGSSTGSSWNYDDEVTYTFGYGLSYTTFEQTLDSVDVDLDSQTVTAQITVTNTGDVAGKDVVQFYVSVPYTDYDIEHGVEKSAIQLLDYAKTDELEPGESQTITIEADAQYMASWDSTASNNEGTSGNYILDEGDYWFAIGTDAHDALNNALAAQGEDVDGDAELAANWYLDEFDNTTFATTKNGTNVENQLEDADLNYWIEDSVTYLSRSDWSGTWPETYDNLTATDEMLAAGLSNDVYEISSDNGDASETTWGADNGLTLADLKGVDDIDDELWTELMDQMELEEAMIRSAFGGTSTKSVESISSPEVIQNDGPNGFNSYTLGQYANTDTDSADPYAIDPDDPNLSYTMGTMVNESIIGQTFSKELAAEWGALLGNYSIWANTTILWGIGTNLHRTPYNARNHEYFSEDAILTAYQGASAIAAAKEYGCILAPKHYAFNDTEINRTGLSVFMTEQKAREGELRAVQACVEDAGTLGMMSAYNRIGITGTNAHTGLMYNILREEWGFQGLLSEDFIMDTDYAQLAAAVHNGVTMLTFTGDDDIDAVSAQWEEWTVENVSQDAQLVSDLKRNMTWQFYAIANSNAMDGMNSTSQIISVRTWYDNALTGVTAVTGALALLSAVMYVVSRRSRTTL